MNDLQDQVAEIGVRQAVSVEFDVPMLTRDRITLRANVYRPTGPGDWPTLLMRTPYSKDAPSILWCGLDPVQVCRQGFVVVIQDVRGRFASEGEWSPFEFEGQDGYDAVEWVARLPSSSGRVGLYGGSYCGNTQWLAAIERPPALAAIAPLMTWADPMDGLFGRGGAVELGVSLPWSLGNGIAHVRRLGLEQDEVRRRVERIFDEWDNLPNRGYWELPVSRIDLAERFGIPELGGIRVLQDAQVADRSKVLDKLDHVAVPSFHTSGWYDNCLQGTLDNYQAMRARGGDHRLVVGPWTHAASVDPIGARAFGLRATRDGGAVEDADDWGGRQLSWFRAHLGAGGATPRSAGDKPVRYFVMGRNEWRDATAWPPGETTPRRWFFHADGVLAEDPPAQGTAPSRFAYDPADPVPTVGGNGVMWLGYPAGPWDQRLVEMRDDVLVYTTAPLGEDLEVTGRIRVFLFAGSTAPSTDWVARLCDVCPDGTSFNICDGVIRVVRDAQALRAYEIDLWSTSNVFLRDHRLRVHITSSSFPRWDRNLNTGNQSSPTYDVAKQEIHHDGAHRSFIELPVVV